jgi:hypothetical protein
MEALGGATAVTHASLDACPPGQARHHLRSLLVDAGFLPVRDEHAARLETWVDELVATLPAHHVRLIIPYAQWKVLRAVRRRTRRKRTSIGVAGSARERVRARPSASFATSTNTVSMSRRLLRTPWTVGRAVVAHAVARSLPSSAGSTPAASLETCGLNPEIVHHTLIRELISGQDSAVHLQTRVSGLLILLYGARIERIHRLTTPTSQRADQRMFVALTTDPIEVPTMLARLFDRLIAEAREDPRALTRAGDTRHLFPSSRRAHEPIHPTTLGRHLVRAGVHPQITRNYAMLALTNDMPAAVVAGSNGRHRSNCEPMGAVLPT